jgi:hypothetical protein
VQLILHFVMMTAMAVMNNHRALRMRTVPAALSAIMLDPGSEFGVS